MIYSIFNIYYMKYLKTFEGYHEEHFDKLLDKISSSGIESLSGSEKDFLDAYSKEDTERMDYISYIEGQKTFVSSDNYFQFKYDHTEDFGDEGTYYYGKLIVPDLEIEGDYSSSGVHDRVDGELEGYIILFDNGQTIPVFEKDGYDILDFCNGIEYELDSFIDYVISTIEDEKLDD